MILWKAHPLACIWDYNPRTMTMKMLWRWWPEKGVIDRCNRTHLLCSGWIQLKTYHEWIRWMDKSTKGTQREGCKCSSRFGCTLDWFVMDGPGGCCYSWRRRESFRPRKTSNWIVRFFPRDTRGNVRILRVWLWLTSSPWGLPSHLRILRNK